MGAQINDGGDVTTLGMSPILIGGVKEKGVHLKNIGKGERLKVKFFGFPPERGSKKGGNENRREYQIRA